MLSGKRVSVSLGAALAIAVVAHTDVARAAEPVAATSLPLVVANGVAFCTPCRPTLSLSGGAPLSDATLIVETWAGSSFEPTFQEPAGVTDEQGDLTLRLPDDGPGIKAISVEVGARRSEPVLVEKAAFCGGPILCPGPLPFRAALTAAVFRPGQMAPLTVSGAPAFSGLEVVLERLLDGRWSPLGDGVRGEADCNGSLTVSLETLESGLYRASVRDLGTGATSNVVLYEVRDCRL